MINSIILDGISYLIPYVYEIWMGLGIIICISLMNRITVRNRVVGTLTKIPITIAAIIYLYIIVNVLSLWYRPISWIVLGFIGMFVILIYFPKIKRML